MVGQAETKVQELTADELQQINDRLQGKPPEEILRWAAGPGARPHLPMRRACHRSCSR